MNQYDFLLTVKNPHFDATIDEEPADGWKFDDYEEWDLGIRYSVSGKYYAATRDEPEEYPEVDFSVFDAATGNELDYSKLTDELIQEIEEACSSHEEKNREDFFY